jgi:hypothetical protein
MRGQPCMHLRYHRAFAHRGGDSLGRAGARIADRKHARLEQQFAGLPGPHRTEAALSSPGSSASGVSGSLFINRIVLPANCRGWPAPIRLLQLVYAARILVPSAQLRRGLGESTAEDV